MDYTNLYHLISLLISSRATKTYSSWSEEKKTWTPTVDWSNPEYVANEAGLDFQQTILGRDKKKFWQQLPRIKSRPHYGKGRSKKQDESGLMPGSRLCGGSEWWFRPFSKEYSEKPGHKKQRNPSDAKRKLLVMKRDDC
jgi:hypothetical protein